jgi:hypothetical protein
MQLVRRAGSFTELINGHEQLSYTSGLLLQDLHTHVGISWEKMPLALVDFAQLMFGPLEDSALALVHRCPETLRSAAERATRAACENTRKRFSAEEALSRDTIVASYLILDDSHKCTDLTAAPYVALFGDDGVRSGALRTMQALTKSVDSWQRIYVSIVDQLTEQGAVRMLGGNHRCVQRCAQHDA